MQRIHNIDGVSNLSSRVLSHPKLKMKFEQINDISKWNKNHSKFQALFTKQKAHNIWIWLSVTAYLNLLSCGQLFLSSWP